MFLLALCTPSGAQTTVAVRGVATDAQGNFQFNAFQAGAYALSAGHAESVTVAAEVAAVRTASGERSGTVTADEVENSNGGNGNNFVSMDSVQAVRIVTSNYQAEFGRKPGAGIMAVTKGGTQRYHGAAYWYYRHEWMNANQFFNNRSGLSPTPRRVQTPGFNIGGPVYIPGKFNQNKNKLFRGQLQPGARGSGGVIA